MFAEFVAFIIAILFWLWNKKTDIDIKSECPVTDVRTNHLHSEKKDDDHRHDDEGDKVINDSRYDEFRNNTKNNDFNVDTGREEGRTETKTDKEVLPAGIVTCSTPVGLDAPNLDDLTRSLMVKEHKRHKLRRHKPMDNDLKEAQTRERSDLINMTEVNSQGDVQGRGDNYELPDNVGRGNNSEIRRRGDDSVTKADDNQIANGDVHDICMNKSIIVDYHDRSGAQKQIKIRPSSDQQQRFLDRQRRRSLRQRETPS